MSEQEQAAPGVPLWSNEKIQSFAWNAPTVWESKRLYDAMRRVRDDYEAERAASDAIPMPQEVRETIKYALNVVLEDYAEGLIVEYPPVIRGKVNEALTWLDSQRPQGAGAARPGGTR